MFRNKIFRQRDICKIIVKSPSRRIRNNVFIGGWRFILGYHRFSACLHTLRHKYGVAYKYFGNNYYIFSEEGVQKAKEYLEWTDFIAKERRQKKIQKLKKELQTAFKFFR